MGRKVVSSSHKYREQREIPDIQGEWGTVLPSQVAVPQAAIHTLLCTEKLRVSPSSVLLTLSLPHSLFPLPQFFPCFFFLFCL